MKKITLITLLISFSFISCLPNDDTVVDTSLSCEEAQAAYETLGENPNCNEGLKALKNYQNACGDLDGEIQKKIDLLEDLCALVG